jgi:LuxR family maltose regulon positive regulatory protein
MTNDGDQPPPEASSPLPMGKLRPVIARPRRVQPRLADVLRPQPGRLTLVHAGAGYGKTTALAATHEPRTTWYNLDATDADPVVLAHRLCAAMGLRPPDLGASTADALALEVARQLQESPASLTLDRWEQIGDEAQVCRFLDGLIQLAPALALRVGTRRRPTLPLERMRLDGRLVDVGPGRLRLERAEIAEVLTVAWQRPPATEELDFADTVLMGWAAAIQLWLIGLESADLLVPLLPGRLLGEYFDEQVLGTLPQEARDRVRREWRWLSGRGALLDRAGSARRRELAERLVRDRVAVVPRTDGWHAHPVLAALARMRAYRGLGVEAQVALVRPEAPDAADRSAPWLAIRTFGGLTVVVHGVPLPDTAWLASSRRLLELLLSLPAGQTTAEEAAGLLWPRHEVRAARNSFNVALHGLRRALEPGLLSGARSRYVVREGQTYRLSLEHLDCDAEEFTRLARNAERPLDEDGARRLRAAVELYAGDFLATSVDHFAVERRAQLRALLTASAESLGEWSRGAGGQDLAFVG